MIYFGSQVAELLAAKDSEIALLKSQLERLEKSKDSELARLRIEWELERKRADKAVDNLLLMTDKGTVSEVYKPALLEADKEVLSILGDIDSAGQTVRGPGKNAEKK